MKEIIIGIDPDSDKHGVAFYINGCLDSLESWCLMDFVEYFNSAFSIGVDVNDIEVHIENVCEKKQTFTKKWVKNQKANQGVARCVGKCQQSQIELERVFEFYNVPVVQHKISKNWKDSKTGKVNLEKNTGWTGNSNEDTRSAAWFGYLGVQMNKRKQKNSYSH